jgi:hypothetical protein
MKKIILAVSMLALVGAQCQTAKANAWPIAAGVLGGLAVGTAVAASAQPVYYSAPPANYYPPTSYYAPAPAVSYAPAPAYYPLARPVVYSSVYAPFPVFGLGFGFGHPGWGGYYRGYYGGYRGGFHDGFHGGGGFHRGR